MNFFQKNLTFLLRERNIPHKELSEALGVKPNTVSNYKNGVSEPNFELFDKIIKFFNVSANEMLYSDISTKNKDVNKSRKLTFDLSAIQILAERIEKLSAENAVLKMENEKLKNKTDELIKELTGIRNTL